MTKKMARLNSNVPVSGAPRHCFSAGYLAILTTAILIFLAADTAWPAGAGEPVAQVNGVTLYQSDLSCAIEASLAKKLTSRHRNSVEKSSGSREVDNQDTLNRLVEIELLYQESLKHRFHGLTEESDKRYNLEVKRFGSEERLMSTLQCNNMTPEAFRKTIYRNLSIKRLLEKRVYSRIKVTEKELREYYELNKDKFRKPESVRVRQIVIKAPSDPGTDKSRQAEERAFTIYRDASTGVDFLRLARRHSEDPASASVGGDMGTIQRGNLQGVLDSVIFKMKEGTVSEPIRTRQGFHIVKVVSYTPSTEKTFEDVKPRITTLIRRAKAREMISQLVNDLKKKAEIEILKGQ